MGVDCKRLDQVCEVIAGQSPPGNTYNKCGDGYPFFQGKADFGELHPVTRNWCIAPVKWAMPNDILLSVRAPVGPTNVCREKACIGRGLSAIRCGSDVDHMYLLRYLRFFEPRLARLGVGSTFQAITQSDIREIMLPLPPLPEQQRIAALLDEADRQRTLARQQLAEFDKLAEAVFVEMFGDPVRNEMGWEVQPLSNCIAEIEAGTNYNGEERPLQSGEFAVLKINAVTWGDFDCSAYKVVNSTELTKKVVPVCKGDLLFSRANTRELVAATVIVDENYPQLLLPDKLWRISLHEEICLPAYFDSLLKNRRVRTLLTNEASGSSGSMMNISMEKLRNFNVPMPNIELQQSYASQVNEIQLARRQAKTNLAESDLLFSVLMHQSFGAQ